MQLDYTRADQCLDFISKYLKDPFGNPVKILPWQRDFFRDVLVEDGKGKRIVREAHISMARKNLKTTTIAQFCVCALAGPLNERGLKIIGAATTRDQARDGIFTMTKDMMKANPQLSKGFEFHTNSIFNEHLACNFTIVGSRESSNHGGVAGILVFDELAQASGLGQWNTLQEGSSNVPNRLAISLSTLSEKMQNPMSELLALRDQAIDNGVNQDHIHVQLYQGNPDADPYSDEQILAANPSAPYLPSLMESIKDDREKAKISDFQRARYKTYRLNIPSGGGKALIDSRQWSGLANPKGRDMLKELRGEHAQIGCDLSRSRDLTSIGIFFDLPEIRFLHAWNFLPTDEIERAQAETRAPFQDWAREGWIEGIAGDVIDYNLIADRIGEIAKDFKITNVNYDAWQADALQACLRQRSINLHMTPTVQGYKSFTPLLVAFENLLDDPGFSHSGSPVLKFCLNNAMVESPENAFADARRLKKAYRTSKIDAAIAACMAIGDRSDASRSVMGIDDLIWGGADALKRKGMAAA